MASGNEKRAKRTCQGFEAKHQSANSMASPHVLEFIMELNRGKKRTDNDNSNNQT